MLARIARHARHMAPPWLPKLDTVLDLFLRDVPQGFDLEGLVLAFVAGDVARMEFMLDRALFEYGGIYAE